MPSAKSKVLLIAASLQTGLLTSTSVTGGTGKQTSTAMVSIVVTPTVTGPNGRPVRVFPPAVTFEERTPITHSESEWMHYESGSRDWVPVITCTDPETIGLLLSTMSAHSFSFLAENVGSGVYTV